MGTLKKPILNKAYNYLEATMSNVAEKKKTTLKPLADRVVAQRLESDETLKGGIIIPDSAKKKQEMAKVIAIGPGKVTDENKTIPIPVKIGDIIFMDKYSGQEITIDDEEFIIVKADDIIAIVE
ncbi:MAG: 10 kDa chaperonin [Candidatus Anoxychlamydiales bacterium]|nr:10 kDa chaperonin [Candidatus Anoxychlamydiales bacterium]